MSEQKIMLGELAAEWFCAHAEGKMARNTEVGYHNLIFNHIIPRLGSVALTDLSEKRIKSFYRALTRSGLSVNANLKMSIFAERECNFSPVSTGVHTALIHNPTCRFEARQALIYQLV